MINLTNKICLLQQKYLCFKQNEENLYVIDKNLLFINKSIKPKSIIVFQLTDIFFAQRQELNNLEL